MARKVPVSEIFRAIPPIRATQQPVSPAVRSRSKPAGNRSYRIFCKTVFQTDSSVMLREMRKVESG